MTKRGLSLLVSAALMGCVRSQMPVSARVEEDPSIVFPVYAEDSVVVVQPSAQPYVLEGGLLRALMTAAQDFLPPASKDVLCQDRIESQRYRVLRQGDLYFIHISEDPAACGKTWPSLDSGAWYAVDLEGRIRRRIVEGMPMDAALDGGVDAGLSVPAEPGVAPSMDSHWNRPERPWPEELRDGGSAPP
jgi:hypothetical protein